MFVQKASGLEELTYRRRIVFAMGLICALEGRAPRARERGRPPVFGAVDTRRCLLYCTVCWRGFSLPSREANQQLGQAPL